MSRLIVIRPEPGAAATVAAAAKLGLAAEAHPLFAVNACEWDPPARDTCDALLLGSANALRHGGPGLGLYRGMPAYAVGETTAQAAREAGFDVVASGRGGLQAMLATLDLAHRRLLRLGGRERMSLTLPEGVTMIERTVYASDPVPMSQALVTALPAGEALVLLHSAEAASHFARECDRLGVVREEVALAVIGPRVAEAAGTGWRALASADAPSDAALLALAADMCQDGLVGPRIHE